MTDKSQSSSQSRHQQQHQHAEQHDTGPMHAGLPELTAEWIVRAQVTIGRPGETVTREFSTNNSTNPVRIVYRWTSGDGEPDEEKRPSSRETLVGSETSTPSKAKSKHAESFNSATSVDFGGGDSAFSGSNTSRKKQQQGEPDKKQQSQQPLYGTRCRSTCNIIVSAVADFLPNNAANDIPEEPDPFVFNTTACYTVLPEKQSTGEASPAASKIFTSGKILALRDAFSQTSDTESKYLDPSGFRFSSRSPPTDRRSYADDYKRQQRRSYDQYRRAADTLLPPPPPSPVAASANVDEGNSFTPSYTPSPTQTCKSASLPRIPPLPGHQRQLLQQHQQQKPAGGPKSSEPKKPRTVHIDVYCTGSDDDDDDEEEEEEDDDNDELDIDDSSSSSAANRHEMESNSTPQTVLDNEQMLLRHQRIGASTLPRRVQLHRENLAGLSPNPPTTVSSTSRSDLNVGHAITKSSTAEEVSESKQILFRKHIGDQRAAKLQNLRQKYIRKDPSEDMLSSNYPNSSRSTMRDATCSSISSAFQSQDQESSWKDIEEIEPRVSLAKSDSFDYDNSVDRLRISQMESLWSRSDEESNVGRTRGYTPPAFLHPIFEGNSQRSSPYMAATRQFHRNDTLPSESDIYSESDNVFYPYGRYSSPVRRQVSHPPPPPASPSHAPKIIYSYPAAQSQSPPAFMQFFGPQHGQVPKPPSPQQPCLPTIHPGLQRWKSETREHLPQESSSLQPPETVTQAGTEAPLSPTNASSSPFATPSPKLVPSAAPSRGPSPLPDRSKRESSEIPSRISVIQGYTAEHLQKAHKFGTVIGTVRKPGHHIGPTKNPNCMCEHCQRWLAERFQIRNRAFSVGDTPVVLKRPNYTRN